MEKLKDEYKAGVVIGSNKSSKFSKKRKKVILALILVTSVLVVGALLAVKHFRPESSSELTEEQIKVGSIEGAAKKNLESAKKDYLDFANSQGSNKSKAEYLRGRGNLCLTHEDYKCVVESYELADALSDGGYESVYNKAYANEKLGNISEARSGYEEVNRMIKKLDANEIVIDQVQIDADIKRVSK